MALLCVSFTTSAHAADKYRYIVHIRPTSFSGPPDGSASAYGLDPTKTTTIRILRLGVQQFTVSYGAGGTSGSASFPTIAAGDQVEVQQPTGVVQETFNVPNVSIEGSVGSANVTGHAPDGTVAYLEYSGGACFSGGADNFTVQPQGGAFSFSFPEPLRSGSRIVVVDYPGKGDQVTFNTLMPGETPCLAVSALNHPTPVGSTPDLTPYTIRGSGMRDVVAPGSRLVLSRNGVILVDDVEPLSSNPQALTGVQPQAGDLIQLFRPHTATTPSASFTIPAMSSFYDRSNALLAVDAPPASLLRAFVGSLYGSSGGERAQLNTADGRTVFNFGISQASNPAINLNAPDYIDITWHSPDGRNRFQFASTPGDLAPPTLGVKLASKFKLTKLGKTVPVVVSSTEPVSAKITLTLPAKLKTSASKSKKPRTLASSRFSLKTGPNKLNLKLTKAGRKLLKTLRVSRAPTQKATLTIVATDSSGNASTKVRTTKLASR